MNFSFPPLPARLADPRLRRWGPPLLAALLCQLVVLQVLRPSAPDPRRGRRAALADDTPTLLRWSRTPLRQAQTTDLQTIPLQGLAALPPPPPSSLPGVPLPGRAAPAPRRGLPVPPLADGLPRQPAEAFRLARQIAQGGTPKEPPSAALVAVQRRQWWLLPGQDKLLATLWEAGAESAPPPSLGPWPDGVAIRSVAVAAVPPALGEPHGRSLLEGDQLWLLWRQGATVWMLRAPVASPEP